VVPIRIPRQSGRNTLKYRPYGADKTARDPPRHDCFMNFWSAKAIAAQQAAETFSGTAQQLEIAKLRVARQEKTFHVGNRSVLMLVAASHPVLRISDLTTTEAIANRIDSFIKDRAAEQVQKQDPLKQGRVRHPWQST
jgi:hypothetical protein